MVSCTLWFAFVQVQSEPTHLYFQAIQATKHPRQQQSAIHQHTLSRLLSVIQQTDSHIKRTHTRTHAHTHTHTQIHAHTHAHTHTQTHAHTHAHTGLKMKRVRHT